MLWEGGIIWLIITWSSLIGLDPAYPLFSMVNTDQRLDTTDAEFVDVIHTHSGLLITSGLSFLDPIGHVDFYPNGGSAQVGCGLISGFLCDMLGKRNSFQDKKNNNL